MITHMTHSLWVDCMECVGGWSGYSCKRMGIYNRPPVSKEEFEQGGDKKKQAEEEEEEEESSEEEEGGASNRPDIQTESAELTLKRAQVSHPPTHPPTLPIHPSTYPPTSPPRTPSPSASGPSSSPLTPNAPLTKSFSPPSPPP